MLSKFEEAIDEELETFRYLFSDLFDKFRLQKIFLVKIKFKK